MIWYSFNRWDLFINHDYIISMEDVTWSSVDLRLSYMVKYFIIQRNDSTRLNFFYYNWVSSLIIKHTKCITRLHPPSSYFSLHCPSYFSFLTHFPIYPHPLCCVQYKFVSILSFPFPSSVGKAVGAPLSGRVV